MPVTQRKLTTLAVAKMLGVAAVTIRQWRLRGRLMPIEHTASGIALYDPMVIKRIATERAKMRELAAEVERLGRRGL